MILLASDFDGTLYQNERVSEYDIGMIKKWRGAGNAFIVATGRDRFSFDMLKGELPDDLFDGYVLAGGAYVYDKEGKMVHSSAGDGSYIPQLCQTIYQLGGRDVYVSAGREVRITISPDGKSSQLTDFHDATEITFDEVVPISEFHFMGTYFPTAEITLRFAEVMAERFAGKFVAHPHGSWCDVAPVGISKESGIAAFLATMPTQPREVLTAGDNYNDISMLAAYRGYAMLGAPAPVVAAAQRRTAKCVGDIIVEWMGCG
ncbi:MAG: Cof-type HAD-IIB family hydrolase [Oscillospiraceae bacterium]|nr:Cof-type HAD-IIB family hydrolase [Oscillospiraceae bacterium]